MAVRSKYLDIAEALKAKNKEKNPQFTFRAVKVGNPNGNTRRGTIVLVYGAKSLRDVKMPDDWELSSTKVKCNGVDCPIIINHIGNKVNCFVSIECVQNVAHLSEFAKIEDIK